MHLIRFVILIVVCVFALSLAACAPAKMTASEATGFCMSYMDSDDGCMDGSAVCNVYAEVMDRRYSSAKECRLACDNAWENMSSNIATSGCGQIASQGRGYCVTHCNYAYPK